MSLSIVVVAAGFGTLGLELAALGLLAPYFGVSQPIWAAVIGGTLLYLALGYALGGRLADRWPRPALPHVLTAIAGALACAIPLVARPLLRQSLYASTGGFAGVLVATLALFALPTMMLAAVGPIALRLRLRTIEDSGRTAGRLSALSTAGSLLGAFLPTLLVTPLWGTARTIEAIGLGLVLFALPGLLGARKLAAAATLLALAAVTASEARAHGPIRPLVAADSAEALVYEGETFYNYVRVTRAPDPRGGHVYYLSLNEGRAVHSLHHDRYDTTGDPADLLTGLYWDLPAAAPFFHADRDPASIKSLLMIGLGAGTVPKIFLALFGAGLVVDGVEQDGRVVEVARRWFGLPAAGDARFLSLQVHVEDGRAFLNAASRRYDVIGIDVYRWPYIPGHVVTREAFARVRELLEPRGVVVMKCDRGPLGRAIAATMKTVFPQVFQLGSSLVAVKEPVGDGVANLEANLARLPAGALHDVLTRALATRADPEAPLALVPDGWGPVLTDDHAPVELLLHQRLWARLAE